MVGRLLVVAMMLAASPAGAQLYVSKRADLARPVVLAPGQAAIIIGFRRPDAQSAGKSGLVVFGRYDVEKRDLVDRPKDAKKLGDTTTYAISVKSGDRKLPLDHAVMLVSAGDYVLLGAAPGAVPGVTNSFCFGAPTFHVNAGETVYVGDVMPYLMVNMVEPNVFAAPTAMGIRIVSEYQGNAMAWSNHPDDARAVLASQPALAAAFRPADLRNGATYGCYGQQMTAYIIPGVESLPPMNAVQSLSHRPEYHMAPSSPVQMPASVATSGAH